jgi:hypothetical protein
MELIKNALSWKKRLKSEPQYEQTLETKEQGHRQSNLYLGIISMHTSVKLIAKSASSAGFSLDPILISKKELSWKQHNCRNGQFQFYASDTCEEKNKANANICNPNFT